MNNIFYRRDILNILQKKYSGSINPELNTLTIVQTDYNVYLESSFKSEPSKFFSTDLDFITEDKLIELEPMISSSTFHTTAAIEENVERFLNELDLTTIAYCFDDIII
jgi:hypothetical protein